MLGREIDNFLQMMAAEKGAAQNSIAAYDRDLRQFLMFGNFTSAADISKPRIESFLQDLHTRQFAPKTIARKLSVIKEFCKFLYPADVFFTRCFPQFFEHCGVSISKIVTDLLPQA